MQFLSESQVGKPAGHAQVRLAHSSSGHSRTLLLSAIPDSCMVIIGLSSSNARSSRLTFFLLGLNAVGQASSKRARTNRTELRAVPMPSKQAAKRIPASQTPCRAASRLALLGGESP